MSKAMTIIKSGVERNLPYTASKIMLRTNPVTKDVRMRIEVDSETGLLEVALS